MAKFYNGSIIVSNKCYVFLPWGLAPAIVKGSDFRLSSNKCPVNLVSKNGLKCCCCPAIYETKNQKFVLSHLFIQSINEVLITESQYHSKNISIWEYHMIMFGRYFMLASRKMCLKIYTYVITQQLKLAAGIFLYAMRSTGQ